MPTDEHGDELEFEDEFEDEYEEEDVFDADAMDADDDGTGDGVAAETEGKLFRAGDTLAPDETLDFDSSAYTMLHRLNVEWPFMSFGVVADTLGAQRVRFPMTAYMVAGTQAEHASQNKLVCMKLSQLAATRHDDDSDEDGDSDDEVDADPLVETQTVAHPGMVNRLKLMPGASHVCATWADTGKVHVWDLSAPLATLHQPGSAPGALRPSRRVGLAGPGGPGRVARAPAGPRLFPPSPLLLSSGVASPVRSRRVAAAALHLRWPRGRGLRARLLSCPSWRPRLGRQREQHPHLERWGRRHLGCAARPVAAAGPALPQRAGGQLRAVRRPPPVPTRRRPHCRRWPRLRPRPIRRACRRHHSSAPARPIPPRPPARLAAVDATPYQGHTAAVEDIQWSPVEGNVLMSCGCDSTVRVWDVRAGALEGGTRAGHPRPSRGDGAGPSRLSGRGARLVAGAAEVGRRPLRRRGPWRGHQRALVEQAGRWSLRTASPREAPRGGALLCPGRAESVARGLTLSARAASPCRFAGRR